MAEPVALKPISGYDDEIAKTYVDPKTYNQTFLEWLWRIGEQILRKDLSLSGEKILYQVPEGYTLFVTSAFLSASYNGVVGSFTSGSLAIRETGGVSFGSLLWVNHKSGVSQSIQNQTLSFYFPIQVYSDQAIVLTGGNASGNSLSDGGFSGFIVKKDLIYK